MGAGDVEEMAVDPINEKFYWAIASGLNDSEVFWGNLDRTGLESIGKSADFGLSGNQHLKDIEYDPHTNKLWTMWQDDADEVNVVRCSRDGNNLTTILTLNDTNYTAVDLEINTPFDSSYVTQHSRIGGTDRIKRFDNSGSVVQTYNTTHVGTITSDRVTGDTFIADPGGQDVFKTDHDFVAVLVNVLSVTDDIKALDHDTTASPSRLYVMMHNTDVTSTIKGIDYDGSSPLDVTTVGPTTGIHDHMGVNRSEAIPTTTTTTSTTTSTTSTSTSTTTTTTTSTTSTTTTTAAPGQDIWWSQHAAAGTKRIESCNYDGSDIGYYYADVLGFIEDALAIDAVRGEIVWFTTPNFKKRYRGNYDQTGQVLVNEFGTTFTINDVDIDEYTDEMIVAYGTSAQVIDRAGAIKFTLNFSETVHACAIHTRLGYIYLAKSDGILQRRRSDTGALINVIHTSGLSDIAVAASMIAVDKDTNEVFFTGDDASDHIYKSTADLLGPTDIYDPAAEPMGLAVNPVSKHLFLMRKGGVANSVDLVRMTYAGASDTVIINDYVGPADLNTLQVARVAPQATTTTSTTSTTSTTTTSTTTTSTTTTSTTTTTAAPPDSIWWVESADTFTTDTNNAIKYSELDGSSITSFTTPFAAIPHRLSWRNDAVDEWLYILAEHASLGTHTVIRVRFDGTGAATIYTAPDDIRAIYYSHEDSKLYVAIQVNGTQTDFIKMDPDGTSQTNLNRLVGNAVQDMAISVADSVICYAAPTQLVKEISGTGLGGGGSDGGKTTISHVGSDEQYSIRTVCAAPSEPCINKARTNIAMSSSSAIYIGTDRRLYDMAFGTKPLTETLFFVSAPKAGRNLGYEIRRINAVTGATEVTLITRASPLNIKSLALLLSGETP